MYMGKFYPLSVLGIANNQLWRFCCKMSIYRYCCVLYSVFVCQSQQNKTWKVVDGLSINDFSRGKMDATAAELVDERDTAVTFLGA